MKKYILLLSVFATACSKPITNKDRAMQTVQTFLKITDVQQIQFSELDSVIDYPNNILRQMAEAQRQLLLTHDTLAYKKQHDLLLTTPKSKYYIINYLVKQKSTSPLEWKMIIMDSTFKIKADTMLTIQRNS